MSTTSSIAEDERFKAGVHGVLLGCTLPVLLFSLMRRRVVNSCAYLALVGFETWHIVGHLRAIPCEREPDVTP